MKKLCSTLVEKKPDQCRQKKNSIENSIGLCLPKITIGRGQLKTTSTDIG